MIDSFLKYIDSFLEYIRYEKRYSNHTVIGYETDLRQWEDFIKEKQYGAINEINYTQIRAWIIALLNDKIQPSSINRKIASLKSFYKYMLTRSYIQENPTLRIKPLKEPKTSPSFVKESEITSLLENTNFEETFSAQRDKIVIEILYGTGIRMSELISLKENNIDIEKQQIKVMGKRKKERIIPITPHLAETIKQFIKIKKEQFPVKSFEYLIITDAGLPAYPVLIHRIVTQYVSAFSNSSKKSPHVLRHTYATHLLNKGADINSIKDLLGHSSLASTQIYTHNSWEKLKKIYKKSHPKA
ncbi:MAG: tyrosine-type recombinase/integrase [Chitinophagaceae bacterium]|nr:tyrosine-type recombinase/integrase [Chitinophagaceae bacterium]